jgi:anti-sigma regulatory factor (Ser/Thr protein kinase)
MDRSLLDPRLSTRFSMTGDNAYCELSFSPNVGLVTTVRRFVSEFYVQVLGDAEVTSRVAVATHELLENAVRYSTDGNTGVRIGVHREADAITITIDTHNRATPPNISMLLRSLEELAAAPDPDAYYQLLMRKSAKRTDGSGLGFGRIRAESDMTVSCQIEGDTVLLRAFARFANSPPS